MNRSLSWIEASELNNRLNELTRPVGDTSSLPVPDLVGDDLPTYAGGNEEQKAAPVDAKGGPETSTVSDGRQTSADGSQIRNPPARRSTEASESGESPPPPPSASTVPVPANQDPWTLTPAQPWTAVVGPSQDLGTPPVPDLDYPATMALAQRLELFRDWMRHYSGEGAFFVSDTDGLPLLLERVRTSQAVTAVALERALHPLRGLLGSSRANSLCIELEDGRLVQTVWASTELGRIAVGMAPPRPLGPAATAQVRRALVCLFENDEDLR